jgi:hypothetical protein
VFPNNFEMVTLGDVLRIIPKWENSGTTPTRKMRTHVNWKPFTLDPPDSYDFPDLDSDGNPLKTTQQTEHPTFAGPKGVVAGYNLDIPLTHVKAAADGKMKILVWGWATYDDVFGEPHRTEFCYEVRAKMVTENNAAAWLASYRRHNCIDDDCNTTN